MSRNLKTDAKDYIARTYEAGTGRLAMLVSEDAVPLVRNLQGPVAKNLTALIKNGDIVAFEAIGVCYDYDITREIVRDTEALIPNHGVELAFTFAAALAIIFFIVILVLLVKIMPYLKHNGSDISRLAGPGDT